MSFANDAKVNGIMSRMMTAMLDNNPAEFLKLYRAIGPLAESHMIKLGDDLPVVLTDQVPVFPMPEWMGLENVGFRATEPFLVAAPPGNGKTIFCGNLAAYLTKAKARVTILQNEGRPEDYVILVYRILQSLLPPPGNRRMTLEDCYREKDSIAAWLKDSRLRVINVRTDGPQEILARMTRMMSKRTTDVILFDWLQNVKVQDVNQKFDAFAYLAGKFEDLSLEWKIPIGVFGQINRDSIRDKGRLGAPGLGSLYGCPDMENKAGLCIYLKNGLTGTGRDYKGPAFLWANIAKHRAGSVGERTIKVDYRSQAFDRQLEPEEIEAYMAHIKEQRKKA